MIDGWALDFIRAVNERPVLIKMLFRLMFGKYAYREFVGLIEEINKKGYILDCSYILEGQDYHNDPIPRIRWWKLIK